MANATPMNETVSLTVHVTTVTDMTLPRWMTPFVRPLFAIPTHMTAQERLMLFQTAVNLPAGFTAVEIGSYLGASTAFLGYAAHTRQGVVHAVDTWSNEAMGAEGQRDTWHEFQANTSPFSHFIVPHRGRSADVAAREGPLPCDLLFIDGDHRYEAVAADLRDWLPSLKPGGVLAMHDIDQAGVKRAFDELAGARLTGPPQVFERLLICRPAAPPA